MKRSRKAKSSAIWADNPVPADQLQQNRAAPSAQKLEKNVKLQKFLIYATVIGAALAVAMSLGVIAQQSSPEDVPPAVDSIGVNSSAGKPLASTTLVTWLAAEPSPLPGGSVVSWNGYESIAAGVAEGSEPAADAAELHFFTLVAPSSDGLVYYQSTVLVSVNSSLGARVMGTPTILPVAPNQDAGWSSETWAGFESAQASEAVSDAVTAWGTAFTGTPAALKLAVGDPSDKHVYIPLSGAMVESVTVVASGAEPVEGNGTPSTIIARVQLTVNWTGEKTQNSASPSLITYDVLVEAADTGAPRIVAWGGAGTGPTLVKYENAVSGKVATVAPVSPVSPTPGPTTGDEPDTTPVTDDEPDTTPAAEGSE